ncbi:dihydrofolate reductase family protein [Falsibacillus pallidus]|uniref:dihydrofolate reductase family protein n=1 Tax=Falsibacillus pallidus TaxID=493781 RepID=UPI003D9767FE
MANDRKVILYIAQSLDGYIATNEGGIDWLSQVEKPNEDYGYGEFIETVDTVIMGRKTYEKVLSFGIEFPHKDKKCYVLSRPKTGSDENVEFYNGNVRDLISDIQKEEGKNIFIDGGAEAVKACIEEQLIDEYVISIIPILLGDGIKLFQETAASSKLTLIEGKTFDTGLVQLKYHKTTN